MDRHFFGRRRWRGAIACLLATGAAAAAPPSADDYTRPDAVHSVVMSPSGKRMAMVTTRDKHSVVAVLDLPPAAPARVVGALREADIDWVVWINDDRLVYSAAERGFLVSAGGAGVLAVDHDGSNGRALIVWGSEQTQIGTRLTSKVLPYGWSVLQPVGDGSADVIVVQSNETVGRERTDARIGRLDTLNGALRMLTNLPSGAIDWVFDARGEPVVVRTLTAGRLKLQMRDRGRDSWTVLDERDAYSAPSLTPVYLEADGSLVVRTSGAGATQALHVFDTKRRALDPEPLARLDRYDVIGIESDEKLRQVVGARLVADRPVTSWFSQRLTGLQRSVDAALPGRFNRLICGNCESSSHYAVLSQSDRQPGEFFVLDAQERKLTPVGARRPWLDEATQGTRSFHWINARDGLPLPVVVTHPPGSKPSEPLPAVVVVHGGPWVPGADRRWQAEPQFLASRGWRVIEPNFRGTLGYGDKHFAASFKQWGLAMQDDLADAVQWAVREKLVDPARVCIYGGSYGGYAALMGPARHPETYRCAASFAGVTDIDLMFTSNRSDFSVHDKRYGMPVVVGDPVADAAALRNASPIQRVADIKVPVLLGQGTRDRRVPREHANAFESAARRAGVAVERVDYGDEGHGFNLHENHSDFLNRLDRFLSRSLAAK